jgi:hypothetical protein
MAMNQPAKPEQDTRIPYPEDTVFLVPDVPYEKRVIQGYLNKKYKKIPHDMIVSEVNMNALPHLDSLKLVVCVRRGEDGQPPGAAGQPYTDERGILRERIVAPETYHHEVYESPAIRVRDHVAMGKATMFRQVEPSLNALIDVLAEHASPFRIFPQNKPDSMLRCMVGV